MALNVVIVEDSGRGFNVLKALREKGHDCKAVMLTNQDIDGLYDKNLDVATVVQQVRQWAAEGHSPDTRSGALP